MTVSAPLCGRCGAPTAWPVERCRECSGRRIAFATARAAVVYEGGARRFVHVWKEGGLRSLDRYAAAIVLERVARPDAAVITYVPADRDRALRRGHHPARGLALELGRSWQIEVAPLLERGRGRTAGRQTGRTLRERRRNMRDAFVASAEVSGRVVVVDDVYTTGATLGAAATALRRAGAARVDALSLARTVR